MKLAIVGTVKSPITVGIAKVYRNKKLLGTCFDTPNAIACVLANINATRVIDMFGEPTKADSNRVKNAGWMTLVEAGWYVILILVLAARKMLVNSIGFIIL